MYRLFDGVVACEFPLPGILEIGGLEPDLCVVLGEGAVNDAGYDELHTWRETDGELELSCARSAKEGESQGYLLRFSDLADFVVTDKLITCHPHPDCREDSLRHLVLDQIIPRVWARDGRLVLHASAVQLPDRRVIACIGESGWGKSTLAAALQARGCWLLSDDSISLTVSDAGVQLIPSYTGLRLNEDSITSLGMSCHGWTAVCHYSDKQRLASTKEENSEPWWLDTLYVIAEPGDTASVLIEPLAGAEPIVTLIKRSFLLDIRDAQCAA